MGKLHDLVAATRETIRNPEDTSQVFRIAEALSFGAPERLARRFRSASSEMIRRKPELLAKLNDRAWLEALPDDSLGRGYLDFIDSEGITPEGLVAASIAGRSGVEVHAAIDTAWLKQRMRDSHDLWHTVTGYRGDLLGETALLAFTFAQTSHPGVGFLAGLGVVLSTFPVNTGEFVMESGAAVARGPEQRRAARRFIIDGFRRGRRAGWFVAAAWEQLLEEPLEKVRDQLGVEAVPAYQQVRRAA